MSWILLYTLSAALAPTLPPRPATAATATSVHLEPVLDAVSTALETCDVDAKDRDGARATPPPRKNARARSW